MAKAGNPKKLTASQRQAKIEEFISAVRAGLLAAGATRSPGMSHAYAIDTKAGRARVSVYPTWVSVLFMYPERAAEALTPEQLKVFQPTYGKLTFTYGDGAGKRAADDFLTELSAFMIKGSTSNPCPNPTLKVDPVVPANVAPGDLVKLVLPSGNEAIFEATSKRPQVGTPLERYWPHIATKMPADEGRAVWHLMRGTKKQWEPLVVELAKDEADRKRIERQIAKFESLPLVGRYVEQGGTIVLVQSNPTDDAAAQGRHAEYKEHVAAAQLVAAEGREFEANEHKIQARKMLDEGLRSGDAWAAPPKTGENPQQNPCGCAYANPTKTKAKKGAKEPRDVPEDVRRYYEEIKAQSPEYTDAMLWATAWSRFCKYKDPGSPHCKQRQPEYLAAKGGTGSERMHKIAAVKILLNRMEGTVHEVGPKEVIATEGETDVWKKANRDLFDWSRTAPKKGGGYDKVQFTVTFEDGTNYQGRYDLTHEMREGSLSDHVVNLLKYLEQHSSEEIKKSARTFLREYDLGQDVEIKANPAAKGGTGSERTHKIAAVKILLNRAEGLPHETGPKEVFATERLPDVWKKADRVLSEWGRSVPEGAYHKADFTVTFEDGETYKGRYDLSRDGFPHLSDQVVSFAKFSAGIGRPAHMSEEQYKDYLDAYMPLKQRKLWKKLLNKYDLGQDVALTANPVMGLSDAVAFLQRELDPTLTEDERGAVSVAISAAQTSPIASLADATTAVASAERRLVLSLSPDQQRTAAAIALLADKRRWTKKNVASAISFEPKSTTRWKQMAEMLAGEAWRQHKQNPTGPVTAASPEVLAFLQKSQDVVDKEYGHGKVKLSLDDGRRYIRVVRFDGVQRFVYGFIDKTSGNILKADSWKKPAKGVRGSVFAPEEYWRFSATSIR